MVKTTKLFFFCYSLAIKSPAKRLVKPVVWSTVFLFSTTVYLLEIWTARGYIGPWWTIHEPKTTHLIVGRLSLMVRVPRTHDPICIPNHPFQSTK